MGFRNVQQEAILLVDEKSKFRQDLGVKLAAKGYKIEQAQSGFHAMHMVENDEYDIVVVAEKGKEMSGQEVLGLIRDKYKRSQVAVFIMGFKTTDEERELFVSLGANGFIPIEKGPNHALELIESLVKENREVSERLKKA